MRRKYLGALLGFTLCLFSSFLINAQELVISGRVLDSVSKSSVPYVNIMLIDKALGTSSNENGEFYLQLGEETPGNQKLLFSSIGYESLIIELNDFQKLQTDVIYLSPNLIGLNEVSISDKRKKKIKPTIINKFNKNRANLIYSTKAFEKGESLWVPFRESEPTIDAMFFPNTYKNLNVYVDKIQLYLSSFADAAIFRIRIYEPNKDQLPGNDLISLDISEIKQGNHLYTLDVSDYFLTIPENGIFIGIELIVKESNMTTLENNEGYTTELHSPFLFYLPVKEAYSFYRFTKGAWKEIKKKAQISPLQKSKKTYKPAISLYVTIEE